MEPEYMKIPYGSNLHKKVTECVERAYSMGKEPVWYFNQQRTNITDVKDIGDGYFSVKLEYI